MCSSFFINFIAFLKVLFLTLASVLFPMLFLTFQKGCFFFWFWLNYLVYLLQSIVLTCNSAFYQGNSGHSVEENIIDWCHSQTTYIRLWFVDCRGRFRFYHGESYRQNKVASRSCRYKTLIALFDSRNIGTFTLLGVPECTVPWCNINICRADAANSCINNRNDGFTFEFT